jgi:protease-4
MSVGDQTDSIFAEPTTTTGSIGVIIPHYDVSGLLEKWDIKDDSLASHPRKKLLSITQEMSPDHREVLTRYLNQAFDRFKEVVESGRPAFRENQQALNDVATGEIFSAPLAKELGLIDRIGFVEDAVARAAEMADLDPESCRVVRYESPLTLVGALGLEVRAQRQSQLETLLDLATPRAYYLSTMFPWILSTHQAAEW